MVASAREGKRLNTTQLQKTSRDKPLIRSYPSKDSLFAYDFKELLRKRMAQRTLSTQAALYCPRSQITVNPFRDQKMAKYVWLAVATQFYSLFMSFSAGNNFHEHPGCTFVV